MSEEKIISSKEFSQITGLSTGTINKYIRTGLIVPVETITYPTGRLKYRLLASDAYRMKEHLYGAKEQEHSRTIHPYTGDGIVL